jgi:hypothetical protein
MYNPNGTGVKASAKAKEQAVDLTADDETDKKGNPIFFSKLCQSALATLLQPSRDVFVTLLEAPTNPTVPSGKGYSANSVERFVKALYNLDSVGSRENCGIIEGLRILQVH